MIKEYPNVVYSTRKEWLRDVRGRWNIFKKTQVNIRLGCIFYPKEVFEWLKKFKEMDKKMREYYKNA